ncbi:hypothetical protein D3C77_186550 [compost metagenome]
MDFEKVEAFIRTHWPAAVIVTLLVTPVVWSYAHSHFADRIASLEGQVSSLSEQVKVLNEFVKRSREAIVPIREAFSKDELFTPSGDVDVKGEIK